MYNKMTKLILWIGIITGLVLSSCSSDISNKQAPGVTDELLKITKSGIRVVDTAKIDYNAREIVIKASMLQLQKKHAEAILEFQDALKYDSSAAILYAIAYNYKEMRKYDNALEFILQSIDKKPDFLPSYELLGEIHRMQGNYDAAVMAYEKVYSERPSYSNKLQLAMIYEVTDKEKALKYFEELLGESEDQLILTHLLILYEELGKEGKSLEIMEKLYNYSPANIRLVLLILETYHKNRNYEKLNGFIDQIEKNLPIEDLEVSLNFIGARLLGDENPGVKSTIPHLVDKVKAKFYFEPQINLMAGQLAAQVNDTVTADKYYSHVLDLADSLPNIPIGIGFDYIDHKRYHKAIDIFKKYSRQYPEDLRYPLSLAITYSNLGDYRNALPHIQKALVLDSNSFDIWAQMGIVYDQLKVYDSSDLAYRKALELKPADPMVNNNYAYSLAVRGKDLALALELSNKALAAEPDNPSYLDTYGWIQYQLGDYEKALKYVKKAIEKGDVSAEVQEHLGDIYIKLKMKDEALIAWKKSLEIDPGRESVIERLNKIK